MIEVRGGYLMSTRGLSHLLLIGRYNGLFFRPFLGSKWRRNFMNKGCPPVAVARGRGGQGGGGEEYFHLILHSDRILCLWVGVRSLAYLRSRHITHNPLHKLCDLFMNPLHKILMDLRCPLDGKEIWSSALHCMVTDK
jgi:hypothetical protein